MSWLRDPLLDARGLRHGFGTRAAPEPTAWARPRQVHGARAVDAQLCLAERPPEADAVVSLRAGLAIGVVTADCVPVLLASRDGAAVAAIHAGWRGLAAGVLEATADAMDVPRNRLLAWLGPAIGPRVYEVGDEVRTAFRGYESAFQPTRPGHWLLDLYAVAREKLHGLKSISGGGFCTYSDRERFFSYRRERGTNRLGAFIWLA